MGVNCWLVGFEGLEERREIEGFLKRGRTVFELFLC